ncbi:hypothetical protein A3Q56_07821 [Intoshia linei]|uniref:Mitochondrial thiamine pyrophosphate carrier n=1 Tax=Intoshia linei TaxID=1819745 RepID=A0A177ASV4_9BILA|nr:hypothetical protein A3Q56_07821 [Intoshia linei]
MCCVVSGALSGSIGRFFVQPLDVLKIRFQIDYKNKNMSHLLKYGSIPKAIGIILQEEGFRGFWRGHCVSQFLSIMYSGVQFGAYSYFQNCLNNIQIERHSKFRSIICGFGAGLTATLFTYPLDVCRTIVVAQTSNNVIIEL